uniref:Uncharacterized protein n=1 Tax=Tetranychus urticae TaxID=32264 RepID=T1JZ29_TETUR
MVQSSVIVVYCVANLFKTEFNYSKIMSLIGLIYKIRASIQPVDAQDLTTQVEDLDASLSNIMNIMSNNEELNVDGKILKILFYGNEKDTEEKYVYFLKRLNEEKECSPQEQDHEISSSQEENFIPNKRVKKENIQKKLSAIKALINQIEKDLDGTKESEQNLAKTKPTIQQVNLEPTLTSKDKEISLKQDLIQKFQVKLAKRRNSFDWIKMVNRFEIPNVEADKMKAIQRTLTSGSKLHGAVIRGVAKFLFGEKKLIETYLMNPKGKSYLTKQGQRFKIFSPQEEKDLKSILSLIDEELFNDPDAWHYLVRAPINQQGLDLKRDLNKKKSKNSSEEPASSYTEDPFLDDDVDFSQYEIED